MTALSKCLSGDYNLLGQPPPHRETGYDGPSGLGTPSAALFPISTGASPTVYDPVTGNLEVHATSPNGAVEEDS